jgi:hypothetical protein
MCISGENAHPRFIDRSNGAVAVAYTKMKPENNAT